MTNLKHKQKNPTPSMIAKAREKAGITQKRAGVVLHTTERTFQQWEYGERKMHPAFWELFLIKTNQLELLETADVGVENDHDC